MANKTVGKMLAFGLAAMTAASMLLAGCGGSDSSAPAADTQEPAAETTESADTQEADTETETEAAEVEETTEPAEAVLGDNNGSTEFTWTVPMPDTEGVVDTWDESPAVLQWLKDCGEDITITWNEAPTTADSDFYNTLIATGEYTDVLPLQLLPSTAAQLYEEGIALDLTEAIETYMPNYMKWVEEHPQYRNQIYQEVDGEERMLSLYALNEVAEPWSGLLYRRDWILKYGKNPETGEAFTGGWQDEDKTQWEDDIVFPSGETYPVYISDWEWMLQIFEDALKAEGVTDGYAVQLKSNGHYNGQGTYFCGFGGSFNGYYETPDGEIRHGWTDDSEAARAYVECMAHWYEEGWIDPSFDERTGDSVFFMIDQATVFSGKVGAFTGLLESQIGNMMNTGNSELLDDICCMCAPQPINDVYGPESVQNVKPWRYFEAGTLLGGENIITEKASKKNIPALLRAIDYTYSEAGEGLSMIGVSDEQQAENQYQTMIDAGLEDGTYTLTTDENGERLYVYNPKYFTSEAGAAISLNRLAIGYNPNGHYDKHDSDLRKDALEKAVLYEGGGQVDYLTKILPTEQADEMNMVGTSAGSIMDVEIPNFITGRTELTDETWEAFQNSIKEQGVDRITEYIRALQ